jgi:hypothetical protein
MRFVKNLALVAATFVLAQNICAQHVDYARLGKNKKETRTYLKKVKRQIKKNRELFGKDIPKKFDLEYNAQDGTLEIIRSTKKDDILSLIVHKTVLRDCDRDGYFSGPKDSENRIDSFNYRRNPISSDNGQSSEAGPVTHKVVLTYKKDSLGEQTDMTIADLQTYRITSGQEVTKTPRWFVMWGKGARALYNDVKLDITSDVDEDIEAATRPYSYMQDHWLKKWQNHAGLQPLMVY